MEAQPQVSIQNEVNEDYEGYKSAIEKEEAIDYKPMIEREEAELRAKQRISKTI